MTKLENIIFNIKRAIINEFRYMAKTPYMMIHSILITDMKESFLLISSQKEKAIIAEYNFNDIFRKALLELIKENIILIIGTHSIKMTKNGDNIYIGPDEIYKNKN